VARLLVAEKPSVARDLARVVGARKSGDAVYKSPDVWVTWCIGHMVQLCEPAEYDPAWKTWREKSLPMLPEVFSLRPLAPRRKHWSQLRKLLRSSEVTEVVNACDAGREGELIFRYVYELAGCKKPTLRLWLASLTDQAVRSALSALRPGADYDALGDAARCRSEADWLVGLNATRALTLLARRGGAQRRLMSVGRVQTPTLALIVEREEAIERFKPEPFWKIYARFHVQHGNFESVYDGTWPRAKSAKKDAPGAKRGRAEDGVRLPNAAAAEALVDSVRGKTGTVVALEKKTRREQHPLLYDLTSLQREANKRYGLSAAATLSVAQELYERHKLLTYPRTDSNYLTTDMVGSLPSVIQGIAVGPYATACATVLAKSPLPVGNRVVNNAEVADHHAIIPTGRRPDLAGLSANARRVFDLVARRFLGVFFPPAVFALTVVRTAVDEHGFVTRGRVQVDAGWQDIDPPFRKKGDVDLPEILEGEAARVGGLRIHEGTTEAPPRFTEGTLLRAMERAGFKLEDDELRRVMKEAGLGTPATRAAVIETLIKRTYVRRQAKLIVPTPEGKALISALPVAVLKSAELTARWESRLAAIAGGREARAPFMADVRAFTADVVTATLAAPPPENLTSSVGDELGICPICRTAVRESPRAYVCENGRDCSFVIFKKVASRSVSPGLVKLLLSGRRSQMLKGFRNKKGKQFQAALTLDEEGRVAFCFDSKDDAPGPPAVHRPARCPACREGEVIRGRRGWGCSRWKQGCTFVIWFQQFGRLVPDHEAARLFSTGQTKPLTGFTDGDGNEVKGKLVLDLQTAARVRLEPVWHGTRRKR
jgi:DNA topoisomerase III